MTEKQMVRIKREECMLKMYRKSIAEIKKEIKKKMKPLLEGIRKCEEGIMRTKSNIKLIKNPPEVECDDCKLRYQVAKMSPMNDPYIDHYNCPIPGKLCWHLGGCTKKEIESYLKGETE